MRNSHEEEKKPNKLLPVTIVLAIAVVVLAGLLIWKDPEPEKSENGTETNETEQITAGTESTGETGTEPASEPAVTSPTAVHQVPQWTAPTEPEPALEDVAVQTQYCALYFSGKWEDSIRTERITEDFSETIVFYGTVNGKEAHIFSVYFGAATDTCIPVGTYAAPDGLNVDVNMELSDFVADDTWTAEESEQIYAMQEQVNYVVEKLGETEGFTPAE